MRRRWIALSAVVASEFVSAWAGPAPVHDYQPPRPAPFVLSVDTATWGELLSKPATRKILEDVDPVLASSPLSASNFGNYTVREMYKVYPKIVTPENIAKINTALAKLPRGEWPVQ